MESATMAEAKPILMPKLGQTVEESTIVKWHKAVGDSIAKGDVMFEIETDKAVLEAESFQEGTLLKILVDEGQTVPVQSVVAYLGAEGDSIPEARAPVPAAKAEEKKAAPTPEKPDAAPPPAAPPAAAAGRAPAAPPPPPAAPPAPERFRISPRARKLAEDRGIDPTPIRGTGPNGRVIERDVAAYLEQKGYDALRLSASAKELARQEKLDLFSIRGTGEGGRIKVEDVRTAVREKPRPMSRMRQVIAQRLTQSVRDIPHFFVTVSVDMTDLLALRRQLKDAGTTLSVNAFVLEAAVLSLKEFDEVNSMTPDGVHVKWNSRVNLGMAVSVESGLVVPVIHGAEDLSLSELNERAAALAERARDGKLRPDEMQGGTFTISNMGMLGVEQFNAIINPGESAILAVASTQAQPVAREGRVAVRQMMKITLSADHRIVDGALGARFVNAIKAKLEDVELWRRLAG
jgi:pyruvate dehydrogenase E2 component (dihydrolipoamide acetyltransferase)